MANSVIDTELVTLYDNWPDVGNADWGGPPGINSLATCGSQNVATAGYPVGTKFRTFQDGGTGIPRGWSTFIYLYVGTQNPDILLSCAAGTNKCIVCPETLSENGTATQLYTVTNDSDGTTMEPTGLAAVAISAITANYYGWFWCGGVAPISLVAGLAGDLPTANDVAIGEVILAATDITNSPIGLKTAAAVSRACGVALKADD